MPLSPPLRQRPAMVLQLGHSSDVEAIAFAPDDSIMATGSLGGDIKLWDPRDGFLERTLPGSGGSIEALAFSHDGSVFATGDSEGRIVVWDRRTGVVRRQWRAQDPDIDSVAFSPDGKSLAGASWNATDASGRVVQLWDLRIGRERWATSLPGDQPCARIAFSPDGRSLAAVVDLHGHPPSVQLLDPRTGAVTARFQVAGPPFAFARMGEELIAWRHGALAAFPLRGRGTAATRASSLRTRSHGSRCQAMGVWLLP